jgi:hypothetical protein
VEDPKEANTRERRPIVCSQDKKASINASWGLLIAKENLEVGGKLLDREGWT